MKRVVKLLLAVLVLCGACDAVGLGDASDNGTGGGGNVNLVGTTWRYTYQEDSYERYIIYTTTLNFTSNDRGIWSTSSTEGWSEAGDFYYSVSGYLITFTLVMDDYTDTDFGSLAGGVLTITNDDGEKAVFYNITRNQSTGGEYT